MENLVEKYRIYVPTGIVNMGNENKVAFMQAQDSPHEFEGKEDAYDWIANNSELMRRHMEFFVFPYVRRER